ncbi:intradiol ring-cleavage dioxygenase [Actinomadura sp. WMMB 499]|uniref:intradiol ring-cleavage dioxygenase n=1 Tax=Actinomadura sp. WMMB 499 TaxID=1219491 RepID=UPI001245E3E6|nr:intradiol ring-cleavage dioxygenase [Actinomadura sp. WMMB 499]QFG22809.1 intradiol ring-cleavage dioxygenase [Actinomadura sp. WMMB 499]
MEGPDATRRTVLGTLGGAALWAVTACAAGDAADGPESPRPPGRTGAAGASPACVLTPEGSEGPYYVDRALLRRDITEGRRGVALNLRTTVVDAGTCRPIRGAAVDVWHADASGVYSGFESQGTGDESFLRGVQRTGADGTAEFDTVFPGWYEGRTVHIHVKVHVDDDVVHTGQLYFDDRVNSAVARGPYARRGSQETVNDDDMFYPQYGRQSTLNVTGSPDGGYRASITLGVRR